MSGRVFNCMREFAKLLVMMSHQIQIWNHKQTLTSTMHTGFTLFSSSRISSSVIPARSSIISSSPPYPCYPMYPSPENCHHHPQAHLPVHWELFLVCFQHLYLVLQFFLFCLVYLCLFTIFRSESWHCHFDSLLFDSLLFDSYLCHTIDS